MNPTVRERGPHWSGLRRLWLFILIVVGLVAASALLSHDHRLMEGVEPPAPTGSNVRLNESGRQGWMWPGPANFDVPGAARA